MDSAPTSFRFKAWLAPLSVSAVLAAVVWALSPLLTGHKEPWDSSSYYYPLALLVAGLVAGMLGSRRKTAYYLGAIVGQILYVLIFLKVRPLLLVSVGFMAVYSVAFYVAALMAGYLRQRKVSVMNRGSLRVVRAPATAELGSWAT